MNDAQRTLSDEQVQQKAEEALAILESIEDDSFAPTNAVRAVEGYDDMTPADRQAINHALNQMIG